MSSNRSTGGKYVPPHLRNSQGGGSRGGGGPSQDSGPRDSGSRGGYDDRRGGGYNDRRGGGGGYNDRRGGGSRGGYDDRRGGGGYNDRRGGGGYGDGGGPAPTNSRWSNADSGGGGGGYRDRGGYGGGGGYRRDGARRNERGFHGDMKPDQRLERQLFGRDDQQTTGINFDNYDKIPVETTGEEIPDPISVYAVETIGDDLFRNTQLCGYTKPTPVQKYSVPIGEQGRDLMACAQTGSGKTAGFLFPIIMSMLRQGGMDPPENARRRVFPQSLILAPTRELASQIQDEARKFTYCTGIASVVVYGGADVREQLRQIERGCDMLVATPGRLVDLIERGRLAMDNVKFLVLDEADRMLGKFNSLCVCLYVRSLVRFVAILVAVLLAARSSLTYTTSSHNMQPTNVPLVVTKPPTHRYGIRASDPSYCRGGGHARW